LNHIQQIFDSKTTYVKIFENTIKKGIKMKYIILQLLIAGINVPFMFREWHHNNVNYLIFGFCLACAFCSSIAKYYSRKQNI